ncbi:MAG: AMP-binding protein [Desulfarculus sp.]|nr:AMP-binding protein [Desulfarculus sp.]
MNLAHILEDSVKFFPDRPALLEDGVVTTYAELDLESGRLASALLDWGFQPGGLAAICLPNTRQWLATYFGVLKAGGVAVALSMAMPRDELTPLLQDCQASLLFTTQAKWEELGGRSQLPFLTRVVAPGGDATWPQLLERSGAPLAALERGRDDLATVLFTGGTTGRAKGVMLSHANLLASAHNVARQERSTPQDRALCFLPLNHVFGLVHITLSTLLTAGSLALMPAFDLDKVLHALTHGGVTKFYSVPTIYVRLLAVPDLKARLGSVRYTFSAAASMAQELVREWKRATGLDIHEAYGLTESAAMVTYNHYYRHKVGSVGTPVGTVEVAIMDTEGRPVPQGSEGEICIQGPNIMGGYLNRPQETSQAFWGPWFRSGDIGYLDEEGYLFIIDRLKDMIITGGENVYPREVEEVLYTHPQVQECAVVGLPDVEWGERVTAFLVCRPGQVPGEAELKAFLKARLSGFKVPKRFVLVDELPKSAAGKILKREVVRTFAGD